MFKAITYKNSLGPGPVIDIGALAEGLIFYERVAVAANSATLEALLKHIPPFILLSLLRDGRLEIHYMEDDTAISTNEPVGGRFLHSLVRYSSPNHALERAGPQKFRDAAGSTSQAKLGASQFRRLLKPFYQKSFDQESLLQALSQEDTVQATIKAVINKVAPDFACPNDLRFKIERERGGQFEIDTNIDFIALNKIYHKTVSPAHSTVSQSYLLALVQAAYKSAFIAATLDTEIAVHPIEKVVQERSIDAVVKRHERSQHSLQSFTGLTLSGCHAIREAVNSGSVPFVSIVELLDNADKFRHWLHEQPADADLLKAYYQEIIKDSWVDKLPGKSMRWSIFTGLGIGIDMVGAGGLGTAAAVATGAIDTFFIDKLIGGWKPHQFVEHELKPLFEPPTSS